MPAVTHMDHDWKVIDRTTNSGKTLFRCARCGWELPAPTNGPCGVCNVCRYHIGSIGHATACEGFTLDPRLSLRVTTHAVAYGQLAQALFGWLP